MKQPQMTPADDTTAPRVDDETSTANAQHLNWSSIPVEHVAEGIERQMFIGEKLMMCRLRFAPHVVTAEHSHPHEQMTMVERGRVRFFIEGSERIAGAGDVLHFRPNCWHGATMMDEEVVLIDIFTPLREDFLKSRRHMGESGKNRKA